MKKTNKIKHVTSNGTFYIDHANHGQIIVDESNIIDSAGLLKDIERAIAEFKMSKQLTERRISNIKTLLNDEE